MAFKAVLLCASVLLVQTVLSCPGGGYTSSFGLSNSGCGCNSYGGSIGIPSYGSSCGCSGSLGSLSPALSSGGDFPVVSVGPIVPTGIAVASDIGLAGDLTVCGSLPFLSAVTFENQLPTAGSGYVDYSCGTGSNVAITSVSGGGSLSGLGGCGCSCF